MKKLIQSSIIIVLLCLSTGCFAQIPELLSTRVYFEYVPSNAFNATAKAKWTISDGSVVYSVPKTLSPIAKGDIATCAFTGTIEQAANVVTTQIDVSFNDGYTGTGKIFPGFPAIVNFNGTNFPALYWWVIMIEPAPARGGTPVYTITQTATEP